MKKLFVTGAGGFLGRHLLARLSDFEKVTCLTRCGPPVSPAGPPNIEWIRGGLEDAPVYAAALREVDAVVHLAALTGKARPADYQRTNVAGTQALVDAAQQAGVMNFLHVSSVAVKFPDKRHYPYGRSKEAGERIIRESGLHYAIVRLAILLGTGSPVWKGLAPLLTLPVLPVFGHGRTPVQPIHVLDAAGFLALILQRGMFRGETLEFGGPEVLSFEELLQRAREKRAGKRAAVVHLPLGSLTWALAAVEPLLFPVLPITAGQLCSFRYSGVMEANPLWEECKGRLKPVREMLE
jgi:NADH dehydrogenase